jgi:hypothetical protein
MPDVPGAWRGRAHSLIHVWWLAMAGRVTARGVGVHHVLLRIFLHRHGVAGVWARDLPAPPVDEALAGAAVQRVPPPPALDTRGLPRGAWVWVFVGSATLARARASAGGVEAEIAWSVQDVRSTLKSGLVVSHAVAVHDDDVPATGAAADAVRTRGWGAAGAGGAAAGGGGGGIVARAAEAAAAAVGAVVGAVRGFND